MTPSFHQPFSFNGPLELKALLAWVGCSLPTDESRLLSAIQTGPTFDWPYLLELAGRHNLKPLLYHRLKTGYADQVPATVMRQLGDFYRANAAKNLAMSGELGQVLKAFDQDSIEGLAFKGPTLSQLAYGSLALRQFGDLDLLIKKNDLRQASGRLEELGYRPQFKLTPVEQARYARLGYEATFWHKTSGMKVDLHWSLLPQTYSFSPQPEKVWQRSQPVKLNQQSVPTLATDQLVLFLCAHGAKHNWSSLHWICDLAALLERQPDFDWESLLSQAGQLGTSRMLRLGLSLAQRLLGLPLPTPVCDWLDSDATLPGLVEEVYHRLYDPPRHWQTLTKERVSYRGRLRAWYDRDQLWLATMEKRRDRLRYWFTEILQPTPLEWATLWLPSAFYPVYYLLRPLRLSFKYLTKR